MFKIDSAGYILIQSNKKSRSRLILSLGVLEISNVTLKTNVKF